MFNKEFLIACKFYLSHFLCNILFSIGIANIIAVVDPEIVVLGGAVPINNPYLIPKIIECVKNKVADPNMVDIRVAQIGDNAGLIGAAML